MSYTDPEPQPLPALNYYQYQQTRDLGHLRLLAILHYIYGGICIVFSSIFIIHVVLGAMMVRGALGGGANAPPPAFGWIFVAMGSAAILLGWTLGVLVIYSGRCLGRQRYWTFSFVIACIICLSIPLGTALGVFTMVVLLRETVKPLYAAPMPR